MSIIATCRSYPSAYCGRHKDRNSACHFGVHAIFPCSTTGTKSSTVSIFAVYPAFRTPSFERKFIYLTCVCIDFICVSPTYTNWDESHFIWTNRFPLVSQSFFSQSSHILGGSLYWFEHYVVRYSKVPRASSVTFSRIWQGNPDDSILLTVIVASQC